MTIFAVTLRFTDDRTQLLAHQEEHSANFQALAEQEIVLLAGAFRGGDGPDALVIVSAASAAEARAHMEADPFFQHDCITEITVRPWEPQAGADRLVGR